MALTAGTVSVANNGAVTKSGMASAIYDQLIALYGLQVPPIVVPTGQAGVEMKRAQGQFSQAIATAVVGYLTANGVVVIPIDGIAAGVPTVAKTFPVT